MVYVKNEKKKSVDVLYQSRVFKITQASSHQNHPQLNTSCVKKQALSINFKSEMGGGQADSSEKTNSPIVKWRGRG